MKPSCRNGNSQGVFCKTSSFFYLRPGGRGETARGSAFRRLRRRVGAASWSRGGGRRCFLPRGFVSPRSSCAGRLVRAARGGEPGRRWRARARRRRRDSGGLGDGGGHGRALEQREDKGNPAAAEWGCGNGPRVVLHDEPVGGAGARERRAGRGGGGDGGGGT